MNNFLDTPAQRTAAGTNVDRRPDGGNGSYNHTWLDQGLEAVATGRTSLIVDPPNGRYPPVTPDGQRRVDAYREHRRNQPADSWLDFSTYDRCILGFNAGPPMTPSAYNKYLPLLAFLTFDREPEQYLCSAVLRHGKAVASEGGVALLARLLPLLLGISANVNTDFGEREHRFRRT